MENGIRADLFGSKPHSKGDIFSRSVIFFLLRIEFTEIRIIGRIKPKIIIKIIISSLRFRTF
jgi:hypothetical protein